MSQPYSLVASTIQSVIAADAWKGVLYVSPKEVIRVTRERYNRKFKGYQLDLRVHIGPPNYIERDFIKDARRAGETFPLKKVQLQSPPKKRIA